MNADTPVQWHDTIDSTNEEARRLVKNGMFGPLWIAAREQTAGRGRLGRSWVSATGNLYCTALFLEPGGVQVATRFPFAAGLAVVDVVRKFAPDAVLKLKWPNDVRVDGAKLSGILVEAGSAGQGAAWVAAGMGINIASAPEGAGQAATSLKALGANPAVNATLFMQALGEAFPKRLDQARNHFPALLRDWEAVAEGLGQAISVNKGDERVSGVFRGLTADGGLRLELPDGTAQTIRTGDVELVKEVDPDAARN